MATFRHEGADTGLSGASFSGNDGDIGRTYTLAYSNAQEEMFILQAQGSLWMQGVDFTLANDVITCLIPMYNTFAVNLNYITGDTGVSGSQYINITDVRRASGVPSTLMTDTQVTAAINIIQDLVAKWLNTVFTPTEEIETYDGNGKPLIFTKKNPLLAVRYLKSDDTVVDCSTLKIHRPSGQIYLGSGSGVGNFTAKIQSVIIKYIHGLVEPNKSVKTTLSTASTAGSSVSLTVGSSSAFSVDDWVDIYGVDGYKEIAQITAKGAGTITVDELTFSHVAGSTIVKMEITNTIKRYMELEASIYAGLTALGGSYNFGKSYSIGDFVKSKDGGAEHWMAMLKANIQERDYLKQTIKIRPAIVV